MADCVEGKQYHDVTGGYQRLDIFNLKIDRSRRTPMIIFPKATLRDQERMASESATMSTTFERLGVRRVLLPNSLNDDDPADRNQTKIRKYPSRFGVADDLLDPMQVSQGKKMQEATSDGAPGGRPKRTLMKSRYHFQADGKE